MSSDKTCQKQEQKKRGRLELKSAVMSLEEVE